MANLQTLCFRCNQEKARGERHRVPAVFIDYERCSVRDGLLEAIARVPPRASPGEVFLLYGRGNRSSLATYEGYRRTGRMPASVYFSVTGRID